MKKKQSLMRTDKATTRATLRLYKEQFTKAKLLEMFETLLVDTEVILMDLDKKRIVKIKQGNKNVELTIGELENTLTTIKNKSYVK